MGTQRFGRWLLIASVMLMAAACQPARSRPAPPPLPTIMPIAMFEVMPVSASAPTPTPVRQTPSGVHLTANISPMCIGATPPNVECVQPYAGEFVITELNGAEVMRVITNQAGQATVELSPGKYILGVRTEDIYPLAAPVSVDVLPDHYVHISLSLDSGLRWQSPRK